MTARSLRGMKAANMSCVLVAAVVGAVARTAPAGSAWLGISAVMLWALSVETNCLARRLSAHGRRRCVGRADGEGRLEGAALVCSCSA